MIRLILACVMLVSVAQAKPIEVFVVSVKGQHALSSSQTAALFNQSREIISEQLGVELALVKFRRRSDISTKYRCVSDFCRRKRLDLWQSYFDKRDKDKTRLKIAVLPPIQESGKLWLAGYSSNICAYRRTNPVAYSNAELFNQDGLERFRYSLVAFTHEVTHLLGASHIDTSANIMHSSAMAYIPAIGLLDFDVKTKPQVLKCVKG